MIETWKPIVGYDGYYEVSDLGRVRSLDRMIVSRSRQGNEYLQHRYGRPLKPGKLTQGYLKVSLGRNQQRLVHRLVLEAFVGECPTDQQCRHLNGNRTDNRLINLCWGTIKEDRQDKKRHGTNPIGSKNPQAKLTDLDVVAIKHGLKLGIKQKVLAAYFGISRTNITNINTGVLWAHI